MGHHNNDLLIRGDPRLNQNQTRQYSNSGRCIQAEGVHNMRDIGGIAAADGALVRSGILYRSDNVAGLSSSGVNAVRNLGIKSVIDLRRHDEVIQAPNPFDSVTDINYEHVELTAPSEPPNEWYDAVDADGRFCYPTYRLVRIYTKRIVERARKFREVIDVLGDQDKLPALFHCTAGKDRTGLVAAIVLGFCGVSDEEVAHDYALSASLFGPAHMSGVSGIEISAQIQSVREYERLYCPPEAMLLTLLFLQRRFGSVADYLMHLGISKDGLASLRELWTTAEP